MHSLSLAGADAAIIVNTRMGPELFAMGGSERISRVPAIFISKESGERLRELLACTKGGVVLELAAHEAVSEARPPPLEVCPPCAATGGAPAAPDVGQPPRWPPNQTWPLSFKYGKELLYVSRTLPVQFATRSGTPYLTEQGRVYPAAAEDAVLAPCLPVTNGACAIM